MIRRRRLEHRFVMHLPDRIEPGVLYISMDFATASHSCCCGCGEEVVTPFSPTDWKMTYDGETVSLWPSVGNWNQPCRSHYVIRNGEIIEARPWSDDQVEAERQRDRRAKQSYFECEHTVDEPKPPVVVPIPSATSAGRASWFGRLLSSIRRDGNPN